MIPSVIASQVQQGVKDFLRTTFPIATPHFHHLLDSLIGKENGLFLGPYLSIHLPFRQGQGGRDFFPDVPLQFPPYLHQERAFQRLSGKRPRSTLVATGEPAPGRRSASFTASWTRATGIEGSPASRRSSSTLRTCFRCAGVACLVKLDAAGA